MLGFAFPGSLIIRRNSGGHEGRDFITEKINSNECNRRLENRSGDPLNFRRLVFIAPVSGTPGPAVRRHPSPPDPPH